MGRVKFIERRVAGCCFTVWQSKGDLKRVRVGLADKKTSALKHGIENIINFSQLISDDCNL
jgi:hypothetical protein